MSMLLIQPQSTLLSFIKMIFFLVLFVIILIGAYYFTKWYAKNGITAKRSKNIQILESYPFGPGKQICIVRIADKYLALSVCKDSVTVIAELDENQIDQTPVELPSMPNFQTTLNNILKNRAHKEKDS